MRIFGNNGRGGQVLQVAYDEETVKKMYYD